MAVQQKYQIENVKEWHKDIFNWEIQHPGEKMAICAMHFGVSASWISIIKNSDIYREYAARQRGDHNERVSKSVIEGVEEVAKVSLDVLQTRISAERESIGLGIVNDAASMALKALGFGAKSSGRDVPAVNINLGVVDPELLNRAREKMRLVNAHEAPALDDAAPITVDGVENEEQPDQPPKSLPAPA